MVPGAVHSRSDAVLFSGSVPGRNEKGRESEEENFNAEIKLENAWELGS